MKRRYQFHLFLLAVRARFGAHFRGRGRTSKVFLFVQLSKLGDMVCTTPLFSAVRKNIPGARIVVLGNEINRELLAGHPGVDRYIVFKRGTPAKYKELFSGENYDAAICVVPSFESLALAMLSGAKKVVAPRVEHGWSPQETHPYRILRIFAKKVPHYFFGYAPREYLRLLHPLGISETNTRKSLAYSRKAREQAELWIEQNIRDKDRMMIGISPSAGNKIKEWPARNFSELADTLTVGNKYSVVFIGSDADRVLVEKVKDGMRTQEHVYDYVGASLDELKAMMSHFGIFIACDTGPIYIAEAFDVPTVDIVGPVDENVQPPRGFRHRVVVPPRERAELYIMNARVYDQEEARRQVISISPQDVISTVEELMSDLNMI